MEKESEGIPKEEAGREQDRGLGKGVWWLTSKAKGAHAVRGELWIGRIKDEAVQKNGESEVRQMLAEAEALAYLAIRMLTELKI